MFWVCIVGMRFATINKQAAIHASERVGTRPQVPCREGVRIV